MDVMIAGTSRYVYTGGKPCLPAEFSAGSGPVVLFIHGAQQDHSCWTLPSRWCARHSYRVLAPDLPGHGRNPGPALASVEAIADWLIALLDELKIEQAIPVGHSLGSLIALDLAARYPQRVRQFVQVTPSLPMPVAPALLDATQSNPAQAMQIINSFSYTQQSQLGGSRVPGLWLTGLNSRLMQRQPTASLFTDMNACNAYQRDLSSLNEIHIPALIIAGKQDRMTPPKMARQIVQALPQATLVEINGGHALMAEQPDDFLNALRDFLPPSA